MQNKSCYSSSDCSHL